MVHENSLPTGDREDQKAIRWTAADIAADIELWNRETPDDPIDINNPQHPEMRPEQKYDVIAILNERPTRFRLEIMTNERVKVPSPTACWAVAELNGWHNPSCDLTTDLLLIHSEVSEACEALRHGKLKMADGDDSVEEELADIVIRAFHTAEKHGLDIVKAMCLKHRKNANRPHRHGNKAF